MFLFLISPCKHVILFSFLGNYCELDRDECQYFPCRNQGACTNLVGGYACTCAAGFEGNNCEININECTSGESIMPQIPPPSPSLFMVKEITTEWKTPALRYMSHSQSASIGGCHLLKIFRDTAKLLHRAWTLGIKSSIEFWYAWSEKTQ